MKGMLIILGQAPSVIIKEKTLFGEYCSLEAKLHKGSSGLFSPSHVNHTFGGKYKLIQCLFSSFFHVGLSGVSF